MSNIVVILLVVAISVSISRWVWSRMAPFYPPEVFNTDVVERGRGHFAVTALCLILGGFTLSGWFWPEKVAETAIGYALMLLLFGLVMVGLVPITRWRRSEDLKLLTKYPDLRVR